MSLETSILSNFELVTFFYAIILLLGSAYFFGYLFQRFSFPRVVGEIFGGLLLGPSLLGFISPEIFNLIFNFYV